MPPSPLSPPAVPDHIPIPRKLCYASGAMADNLIMNAFSSLVLPVYNIALFVNPVLLGWAVAIPRFFDAITDPIMGSISDNTRSRWGRRRPYIFAGAIGCAVLLPLLWMSPWKGEWGVFTWLTLVGILYFLAYTVFIIPYQALGFEMTTDYDERTRLLAWPNYLGMTLSFFLPWLPRMIEYQGFGGAVSGAIYVSLGVGVVILITGILPALFPRVRHCGLGKRHRLGWARDHGRFGPVCEYLRPLRRGPGGRHGSERGGGVRLCGRFLSERAVGSGHEHSVGQKSLRPNFA
ncbi:hypothetical protein EBT11_01485 [bacterium]|nr:hypothetical protein [bacterium]